MKREVADIKSGFSVENVRFMKPGDRSRCIKYKADYGTAMSGNKLELCTFAARMPRMPHKTGSSGFILGEYGNARRRC